MWWLVQTREVDKYIIFIKRKCGINPKQHNFHTVTPYRHCPKQTSLSNSLLTLLLAHTATDLTTDRQYDCTTDDVLTVKQQFTYITVRWARATYAHASSKALKHKHLWHYRINVFFHCLNADGLRNNLCWEPDYYYHTKMRLRSVRLAIEFKLKITMERKVRWDVGRGWGCRGKERTEKLFSGEGLKPARVPYAAGTWRAWSTSLKRESGDGAPGEIQGQRTWSGGQRFLALEFLAVSGSFWEHKSL